jgi:hypothetical protein
MKNSPPVLQSHLSKANSQASFEEIHKLKGKMQKLNSKAKSMGAC